MCDFNETTNTATFEDSELAALLSLFGGVDGVGPDDEQPVSADVPADEDEDLSDDEIQALNAVFEALFGPMPSSENSDADEDVLANV